MTDLDASELKARVLQAEEHAPGTLPGRLATPLMTALTFLAKEGHDRNHHWLADRLARAVMALPAGDPFDAVLDEIRELNKRKRSDYTGGDPWENFKDSARQTNTTPGMSAETLIATKQSRLRQLLQPGREPANESLRDSLLDRCVYSVIALALYDAGLYEKESK